MTLHNASQVADNAASIRDRIAQAARRSGRSPEQITLVAVTKYVGPAEARQVVAAGCPDLGESRPQHLWEKADALADLPVRWHMIGHLQRNKARRTLPLLALLHSADGLELLDAVNRLAGELGRPLPVLLEVNISGDATKHGFQPTALEPLLDQLPGYGHLQVRGLMGMGSLEGGSEQARRDFSALRILRDRLRQRTPPGVSLDELSMGMSGDYEVAIEEGATLVRVGSALFEGPAA